MPIDSNIKILLVEDAKLMQKMERKTLNALGFENIVLAEDGNDAVNKLQQEGSFDLIISDWNMPNKSGYDLLVWVRGNDAFKSVPFIMATGRGEKKEVNKATEAGVSSFISKPFNADELREKIEEAFGLKQVDTQASEKKREFRMTASGKVMLNVAHIQITDHLVLGVMRHLIQTGELTPKHFELQTHCMSSWNPVAKALEDGSVVGACVLAPIAMDLYSYNVPIKLVLLAHKNGSIFVRNKKGGVYKEPYQNFFRGKSFYIPHTLSIHNMLAHIFFKGIGLRPGVTGDANVDVSFEVTPPIKMPEFLGENSNACGYLVAEPLGTKAIATDIAELQFLSSELWPQHPCCVVVLQNEFINAYPEAVHEFTQMLVHAGKFIEQKPGMAAEIAVNFLDPDKKLGLKVPLLKNVLTEPAGIKTGDLFPVIEDLERIQRYMHDEMRIGNLIDLNRFVDLRFARVACGDQANSRKLKTKPLDDPQELLLRRAVDAEEQRIKSKVNLEGKYLTFSLGKQEFGIDILKIKEIIGMMPVRAIPQTPKYIRGLINLRGRVIPVIDIRLKFGMPIVEYNERSCIIILEIEHRASIIQIGIAVDAVSEISNIRAVDIDEPPKFGDGRSTEYILAMAKANNKVKILLDIDKVMTEADTHIMAQVFEEKAAA
ncbi:chemotaxis protein CheW [candidate division KSB1 bacterium]|nr:chemotaxis protein CheW [candidate division KSB1 bacterium]